VKGGGMRKRKASVHEVSGNDAVVVEVVAGIKEDSDGVMQSSNLS